MAMVNVNIRMEKDVKDKLNEFCKEVGMNMSTLFNVFAKKVVRENKVPFRLDIDPFYSEENVKFIKESIKQLDEGKVIKKSIDELERMENEWYWI